MKQMILVAFDESENAMRAVKYVADSYTPENKVTLFSVIPDAATLCEMSTVPLNPYFLAHQQTFFKELEKQKRENLNKAVEKAKELLLKAGFNEKNITVKIEIEKNGVANNIVKEAESGYNIIVMGRRGLSSIKEFLLGSVSQKVIHLAKDISVLIVN